MVNRRLTRIAAACGVMACFLVTMAADGETSDAHAAAAVEFLNVLHFDETFEKAIAAAVEMQIKQNPGIEPYRDVLLEFFSRYMSWDSMKDEMVQIYVDAFTTEDLEALRDFYATPVGQKAALLMPELLSKGGELGIRRVQEHMPELQLMVAEEARRLAEEQVAAKTADGEKE